MRPKIKRHIGDKKFAKCSLFKPNGIPASRLQHIALAADELAALQLADIEGLSQQDAALQMLVSRQTFANILKRARFKVTQAIIEGHALTLPDELVNSEE